jgi:rare lipoprotein A
MGGGRWWTGALVAASLGAAGCSLFRGAPPPPGPGGVQVGVASWYGPGFDGNRTANGEIYDQYEMTAAHRTLPLGTRVMVTNLSNGRSVEVRINDRGPFVDGRAIDLSYAAARALRMVGPGTAHVRIEVLRAAAAAAPPPLLPPPARDLPTTSFLVEVAVLHDAGRAEHLAGVLRLRLPDTFVSPVAGSDGTYYRVRVGPYPLRTAALARAERVTRLGYPAIIVEEPH